MKINLPNNVASSQDLTDLILEIQDYARWFEHESIKVKISIKHVSKSPILSPSATQLIHESESKQPLTMQKLDEILSLLKNYSNNSPTITFTLAAPATNDIKLSLVDWCRKNILPNTLVNFKFNSSLLGGMVVHCGSHIFDWSFRRQILENRDRFPEVLRNV